MPETPQLIVIAGVCGSGKSTVAKGLTERLLLRRGVNYDFVDADDFHSEANKAKMRQGIPLTDADRADWLRSLAELSRDGRRRVLACSALKKSYRSQLSEHTSSCLFFILHVSKPELLDRLHKRHSHFAGTNLLDSQLATLELPTSAAEPAVHVICADSACELVLDAICNKLCLPCL